MRLLDLVHEGACFASRYFEQELRGTLHRAPLPVEIDAAFEPERCVGMHAVGARTTGHEWLWPECRFEKYVGRLVADRRAQPAHDAGEAYSTAVVGDDKRIVIDRDFLFVEQRELLALLCQPRPDGALHTGRVISVQGCPSSSMT